MDTKSTAALTPLTEDSFVYIAIKGSLYANDCSVFGLGNEEVKALVKKYPGSGTNVVNGITVKTHVMQAVNSLALLGYKVISSTGEAEITWTLQREV
ncbi:uncharacterized protein [Epargyreus clarus]|uniref:uncharacterized protein n=1 Tax=Epargyreus clarus TaxID=520877 RepID=UPI003C30137B